jgi:hypothetical protein
MDDSAPLNPCVEKTIELVFETFRGVTREGGVSWSESFVLDDYGSEEECHEARLQDNEPGWEALANDPDWDPFSGIGGFCFLDIIGFRYYLPAAMIKVLKGESSNGGFISYHLELPKRNFPGYWQEHFSTLQQSEIQCICEFLKCMIVTEDYPPDPALGDPGNDSWEDAYRSHWVNLDANPLPE